MKFDYDDTLADPFHGPLIAEVVADILANGRGEHRIRAIVARAVHEARNRGAAELALDLTPSSEVARELDISIRRVQALAQARGVGERYGRELLFRRQDIDALRERRPGNHTGRSRRAKAEEG